MHRHCMVVHAHYPHGETRVQREAEALASRGCRVDVISLKFRGEPFRDLHNGIRIFRLPIRRGNNRRRGAQFLEYLAFFLLSAFLLTALHIRRAYRVIQIHNLPDFLVFSALIPRISGARIILDLHDLMPEFYLSQYGGSGKGIVSGLILWQERMACAFAHHVITVTEQWRRILIRRGIAPEKCSVVMNAADDRIFQRQKRNPVQSDSRKFLLLYHGNLSHRNGIDLIIYALSRLHSELPDLYFKVHGGGDFVVTLKKLAEELKVADRVFFSTRMVSTGELPALISGCDVGVVPIRQDVFTDGILPTKLMEYAALGIPVIAARTTVIREYFDDSMVEFFEPENVEELSKAIRRLYLDRARRSELADNIQNFNRDYSWSHISSKYVNKTMELARVER